MVRRLVDDERVWTVGLVAVRAPKTGRLSQMAWLTG